MTDLLTIYQNNNLQKNNKSSSMFSPGVSPIFSKKTVQENSNLVENEQYWLVADNNTIISHQQQ